MARFIIERNFAEQLELDDDVAAQIRRVDSELGNEWIFSFLSADKKKTYCVYEAPDAETIRSAAQQLNLPADNIVEIGAEIRPDSFQ